MIYETIKESNKQFSFKPEVANEENLYRASSGYVVVGMGGSHLAADLLKILKPGIDIIIHRDYGLPDISIRDLKERLVILSSYSGNTEEVLDAYKKAGEFGLGRAVVSIGGKLLELAQKDKIAHVQMPDLSIQPRLALPLNLMSLLKLMNEETMLKEAGELENTFHPESLEEEGRALAEKLHGHIPVTYSSEKNQPLAYNWKVKFNETAKIPAFYNVFPEANHNEIEGFSTNDLVRNLSEKFCFIFLSDPKDSPEIQKRMEMTAKLYQDRGFATHKIELSGANILHKIFNILTLADFTSYFIAKSYNIEPEQTPTVEEFKNLI